MRKADGARFERQFKDIIQTYNYTRRLPTLRMGYSGLSQPADFIVVGHHFNYVEVKETAGGSFSVSALQQLAEIEEFIEEKNRLKLVRNIGIADYWLIIHFLGRGISAVKNEDILWYYKNRKTIRFEINPKQIMKWNFKNLKELREEDLF